jgi:hypothetical protein
VSNREDELETNSPIAFSSKIYWAKSSGQDHEPKEEKKGRRHTEKRWKEDLSDCLLLPMSIHSTDSHFKRYFDFPALSSGPKCAPPQGRIYAWMAAPTCKQSTKGAGCLL